MDNLNNSSMNRGGLVYSGRIRETQDGNSRLGFAGGAMLKSLMRPSVRFVFTTGIAGLGAVGAAPLLFFLGRRFRNGDLPFLLGVATFALTIALCPYLASKRCWISHRITLLRAFVAALPLFFILPALFLPML